MAVITSEVYKEKIYTSDATQILEIIADGEEINGKYIRELKLKDYLFDGTTFYLGATSSCTIDLSIDSSILEEIPKLVEINYKLLVDEENGTYESFSIGIFDVIDYDNSSSQYIKLTLSDFMNRFDKEYDPSSIMPCTRKALLENICMTFNVELGTETFINQDVLVGNYDSTYTAKKYLSFIAERAAGYAKIGRDGKLYINSYTDVDTIELPAKYAGEFKEGSKFTITKVIYENGVQRFAFGDDTGYTLRLSQDNLFSCTETEVQNIYNSIKNLSFQSLELKIWGDPSIDTGDFIKFQNVVSFCQKEWTYNLGFTGKYKTNIEKIESNSSMSKKTMERNIKNIHSSIDEINGTLEINATQISENSGKINNLIIDVNAFKNIFQITGGNNLIKNSAFLFTDELWEFIENGNLFDHTNLGSGYNGIMVGSTVSCSEIILQDAILKSKYNNIQNLKTDGTQYTLNFYYKQEENVTTKIKLYSQNNDDDVAFETTFSDEVNTLTRYSISFVPDSPNYYLEITTSTISSDQGRFFLYDLMLNSGDLKSWEPYASETYGTILKMTQYGLQVYSQGANTMALFNASGIQMRKATNENEINGDIVTDFNDKGMSTIDAKMVSEQLHESVDDDSYWVKEVISINGNKHLVEYYRED